MKMENAGVFLLILLAYAMVPDSANAQGAEKRRTGNTCMMDTQCPDNAFCKAGSYCVCKDGYIFAASTAASSAEAASTKACLKVGNFGDPCVLDVQCHTSMGVHAECLLGTCSCQTNTQLVGDRCYRKAVVGEHCIVDNNCYLADAQPEEQAFCVRGFCTCQLHFSPRDNGTRCVRDAKLWEPCLDNNQCAGVGLECRGSCVCMDGFAANNESYICVQTVKELGARCEYDVQCAPLAGVQDPKFAAGATMCLGAKCGCGFNAREAGDPPRCYNIRRPGQICRSDHECLNEEDEPGFCRNGRCSCHGCVPDASDFDGAGALTPLPLVAAILAGAAILV